MKKSYEKPAITKSKVTLQAVTANGGQITGGDIGRNGDNGGNQP